MLWELASCWDLPIGCLVSLSLKSVSHYKAQKSNGLDKSLNACTKESCTYESNEIIDSDNYGRERVWAESTAGSQWTTTKRTTKNNKRHSASPRHRRRDAGKIHLQQKKHVAR
ncbi:hypothetical protein NDU88_006310 [Pleurodeles waltl]|uniref:Uncharacterized protein n=1 Tax=Pleurodeles waltl TaxID=8319 RepID=A0AAV7SP85_PLEWA|nr:hypothetical protein NDU88_006310 [Pleurodeles waltl]